MPTTIAPEIIVEDRFPDRKRFTRDEVQFLADNGLLKERWELIDGEIIIKMAQNPPRSYVLDLVAIWLEEIYGRVYVRTQRGIEVALKDQKINFPEPDVFVMTKPIREFIHRHPSPDELQLVVEIADTTLASDIRDKSELYARAGIVEYWVADVNKRRIIVHQEPKENNYNTIITIEADSEIAPTSRPDAKIRVSELFLPAETVIRPLARVQ